MKCSFCGNTTAAGTGKVIVRKDGSMLSFCGTKCERNHKIREPVKVKWTEAHRKADSKQ
ncbi:MAG: 50S ribosomal protein L24e [Candidatus Aenigmarchaeota archaeon]|nr:50S ribosomal protein L24e [Candidatus Aenigmarchaeota archaeon]